MAADKNRNMGMFIGLAVGDALGAPVEFKQRGSYPAVTGYQECKHFGLPPGGWTDDTSMALALAESLINNAGRLVQSDVMDRWKRWMVYGEYSHTGACFDIGMQTRKALNAWEGPHKPQLRRDNRAIGNGCIMRLAPLAIVKSGRRLIDLTVRQTEWTHPSREAVEAAVDLANILDQLKTTGASDHIEYIVEDGPPPSGPNGTARDCLYAAVWAVHSTDTFKAAVLAAVNMGDDTDTVGAVTGMIAGAMYGWNAIPDEWVKGLAWSDRLVETAEALHDVAMKHPS
jgi:ADP-ribosyl-[dinitrogen reductase] hydrolase